MSEIPTVRQAVEMAVRAERIGQRFYTRVANRFENSPEVSEVFRMLAEDEQDHEERFEKLLAQVPEDPPEVQNEYGREEKLRAIAVSDLFSGALFEELDRVETVSDALIVGARFEENAMKYYDGLRDILGPSPELNALVAEEKRHLELLTRKIKQHVS